MVSRYQLYAFYVFHLRLVLSVLNEPVVLNAHMHGNKFCVAVVVLNDKFSVALIVYARCQHCLCIVLVFGELLGVNLLCLIFGALKIVK